MLSAGGKLLHMLNSVIPYVVGYVMVYVGIAISSTPTIIWNILISGLLKWPASHSNIKFYFELLSTLANYV